MRPKFIMTKFHKISVFILRISMGWLMFYSGITKVLSSNWSAAFYLKDAKTFHSFFNWLLQPGIMPVTNNLVVWGEVLIGAALILGIMVRLSSIGGFIMMLLFYLPILSFPYPDAYSFIVNYHIIYAFVFLALAAIRAGRTWGLENWCSNLPICSKYPRLRAWLG